MDDVERYRKALERIARWDARGKAGYLDEWQESEAFSDVQQFASEVLDPESRVRRIAAQDARLKATLASIREFKALSRCFYMTDTSTGSGCWVRVIKGDADRAHEGAVRVKVLEIVGRPRMLSSDWTVGSEQTVNVSNLSRIAPDPMSDTDPSGYCLVSCVTHVGVATVGGKNNWPSHREACDARETMRDDGRDPSDYTPMPTALAKKTGRIP